MGLGGDAVKIETSGIDDVIRQMGEMQQLTGEVTKNMLRAGGNVLQRAWTDEANRQGYGSKSTGDMIKSIGQTNPKETGNGLTIEVYPKGMGQLQGKRKKWQVRNSVKAFVLHHGRKGRGVIRGSQWVDKVAENAADDASNAMAEVWGRFIATGKVPKVKKMKQK